MVSGVLLDGFTGIAGQRGRFPADAIGDDPSRRRRPFTDGQHVHIASLHTAVQQPSGAQTEAAAGHQNQELRIRVILNSKSSKTAVKIWGWEGLIGGRIKEMISEIWKHT